MLSQQKLRLRLRTSLAVLGFGLALAFFTTHPSYADDVQEQNGKQTVGENTGLALPRFASLKSNHINARSGPGDTYPVKTVYKRSGLTVEIVSEFKLWREIVDMEGEHGWVHKAMLSGNRTAILKDEAYGYESTSNSGIVAKLEKDAQVGIHECTATMCEFRVKSVGGWVEKSKLWGVYPNEIFD